MYYLQAGRPIMYRWISTESESSTFEKFPWNQIHPSLIFASAPDVQPGFQTQLRFRWERSVSIFCGKIIHRLRRVSAFSPLFFIFYFLFSTLVWLTAAAAAARFKVTAVNICFVPLDNLPVQQRVSAHARRIGETNGKLLKKHTVLWH